MSEVRLIDANALKYKNLAEVNGRLTYVLTAEEIDNAPTVEPTFKPIAKVKFDKEQLQKIVDKAKAEVLAGIERPQGEWIEGSNGNIKCNKCGAEIRYSYIANNKLDFPKFCCDCGADMRPKTCTNCETFGHDCGDCEVGDDD